MQRLTHKNQTAFAVGTGRCGTKFLHKIIDLEPRVSSVHERNPLNETFHRYCKWYNIQVDHEGFLRTKEKEILEDLKHSDFSFESSAHLSLSIRELYDRFNSKFVFLIRAPHLVVDSYLKKGWYEKPIIRSNENLPPSYQECYHFHHFLGRIIPYQGDSQKWFEMTRVGKLAWYWHTLNLQILEQLKEIPEENWRIQKLENLSYTEYLEITHFLGFKSTLKSDVFASISRSRPNSIVNVPTVSSWSKTACTEFEEQVAALASDLGYEYKTEKILNVIGTSSKKFDTPNKSKFSKAEDPNINPEQVTVIIRSVGERTTEVCHQLLVQQVPYKNIFTTYEFPFSKALKQSFKIGIQQNLPWTLCIDADVLIKQNAIREILKYAETLDENCLGMQGTVLCKFFGGLRLAGNRLYRTELLPQALENIPIEETLRPETDTICAMEKRGFEWKKADIAIGLHDYEQFYKDIYRKCFTQAHKHRYLADQLFKPLWSRLAKQDADYRVALWGLKAGLIYDEDIEIDAHLFPQRIDELLEIANLNEKKRINYIDTGWQTLVDEIIKSFSPPTEYETHMSWQVNRALGSTATISKKQVTARSHPIKYFLYLSGKVFRRTGKVLQEISGFS